MEGERIRIEGKRVLVDDRPLKNPYQRGGSEEEFYAELIVPKGCVFVLNDMISTRGAEKYDSRGVGPIPMAAVEHVFSAKAPPEGRKKK